MTQKNYIFISIYIFITFNSIYCLSRTREPCSLGSIDFFSSLTLKPMGPNMHWRVWNTPAGMGQKVIVVIEQIDHSHSPSIVSVSADILCGALLSLVHTNKRQRSRTSNRTYLFLYIQKSSWRTNKAIILCWDVPDMETKNRQHWYHCHIETSKTKMASPALSTCHDLYQIYQVLSLHISS